MPSRAAGVIIAVQIIHPADERPSFVKTIIDSRQLLTFTALARRGSFTLAAKDLFLTQSAVSHAIKALEEEVGSRLVDRNGKRVLLTQAAAPDLARPATA